MNKNNELEALAQEQEDRSKEQLADEHIKSSYKNTIDEYSWRYEEAKDDFLAGFSACEQSHAKTVEELKIQDDANDILTRKLAESLVENQRLRDALALVMNEFTYLKSSLSPHPGESAKGDE